MWGACGVTTEWSPLKAVLLHRPGVELEEVTDPEEAQMLAPIDAGRAQRQHDGLAQAYRDAGVVVHYVEPIEAPPPNLMFVADLMVMTPEGAILGRPASTVRAGEERFVARRLAELGIPILRSVRGRGTFEGADAAAGPAAGPPIAPQTVLLATGLRTNAEGAAQVADLLREMGVQTVRVGLPYGAMHLMGQLRFADRPLAIAWPGRVPYAAVEALRARGYAVLFLPDEGGGGARDGAQLRDARPTKDHDCRGPGRGPAAIPSLRHSTKRPALPVIRLRWTSLPRRPAASAAACLSGALLVSLRGNRADDGEV